MSPSRNTTPRRLCVFCGSSMGGRLEFEAAARDLGRAMADAAVELVYGGGHRGLMGALAESVLAHGGRVTGIIPSFLTRKEDAFLDITRLEVVETMHERKARMAELADGFCVLPGGFGTLDETFEILTWRQLGLHDKPLILMNTKDFWAPMLALADSVIDNGFAPADNRRLFQLAETPAAVLEALASARPPTTRTASERL